MAGMVAQLLVRAGTAAEWTSANPTLGDGEWALEGDTRKVKLGDGVTPWAAPPYFQHSVQTTGAASYTHAQSTPASEWSVPHTLGVRPASLQVEVGGLPIIPDVLEFSETRVVLAFGEAYTGLVTLLKGN